MMTIKDIGMMLQLLEANYGNGLYKDTDRENVINLWSVMFEDDDPAEVAIAVKDCIATLTFPPKVADIKTRISQNRLSGQMTEMEAWAIIRKATEDANSYEKAVEVYNAMPTIIQRVVCSPSQLRAWRTVEDEQFETVVCSNVLRSYRVMLQREAGYHALPSDIQKAEAWRIEAPKQAELPQPKKLAYEPPEWMISKNEGVKYPKIEPGKSHFPPRPTIGGAS